MKNAFHHKEYWNISHVVMLVLLSLLCYWPISSGLFSAKNDNITQFLPVRFHVSEALRNGHLPLWTPYIYLGFPMHGDMQGGAWNPVVWLLSIFGRYQVNSLHAEIILYIIFSGMGMYRLLTTFRYLKALCLAGAGAYLMCGYITDVGGSNLPFLAAAAYIPFVFAYYYQLLTTPSFKYAFKTAVALTLLFVSAYPSFFICTCYVLLAAGVIFSIKNLSKDHYSLIKDFLTTQGQTVLLFVAFSAPAIISYAGLLHYYERGGGIDLSGALENSFDPSCMLSFIFPSAQIKNPASYATDLISRNSYFNLLLLPFFSVYFFVKKKLSDKFILAGIFFFLLFSLGDATPVRAWCYNFLPLMDTFRHPSNARLFVILGGIVLALTVLNQFLNQQIAKKYLYGASLILIAFIVINLFRIESGITLFSKISTAFPETNDTRSNLKIFFQTLSYGDHIFANGVIQLCFLLSFLFIVYFEKIYLLSGLIILNSFFMAQFVLPYTLVSKVPPAHYTAFLKSIPNGYPQPEKRKSLDDNQEPFSRGSSLVVMDEFYNKKIAAPDLVVTPTFMKTMKVVYSNKATRDSIFSQPYAYFNEGINTSFALKQMWCNGFVFSTTSPGITSFRLQQILLPGWKSFIDGRRVDIRSYGPGFISIPIPPGQHEIRFVYQPFGLVAALLLSIISFLVCIVFLFKKV